jgi:hypothetical protein
MCLETAYPSRQKIVDTCTKRRVAEVLPVPGTGTYSLANLKIEFDLLVKQA